jgi:hypothetical protein
VTVCNIHKDYLNFVVGGCVITALGHFDHRKGGHMVLKQPKLVVEFPHGMSIALPSASVGHGNIPIQEGETRSSFTQFTAGGIFRYVASGFRTDKVFKSEDPKGKAQFDSEQKQRWIDAIKLYSTVEELNLTVP